MRDKHEYSGQNAGVDEPVATAYCFGGFRLHVQQQRLEFDGEPLALTTKLYYLLLTFLSQPGEVLSKETIVDAVWPGQVVTDAALAKQIQRLRGTLNDGDHDPPYIETHRGRGYRFTCPVTIERERQQDSAREKQLDTAIRPETRRKGWALALAAVAGVVTIGAILFVPGQDATSADPRSIAVLPVANLTTTLSEGAAEYLVTRLGAQTDLAPLLESTKTPSQALKVSSLELFRLRRAPVIALNMDREGQLYRLRIDQRSEEGSKSAEFENESIARVLAEGEDWIRLHTGLRENNHPADNAYALTSHFEGLASPGCDQALQYFRAAITSDPGLKQAQLHLARCEQTRGNAKEAAAAAIAVLNASTSREESGIALNARLIAARAFMELGDANAARAQLEAASKLTEEAASPLQELSALAVLALLANMEGAPGEALNLHRRRLEIANSEYPLPAYLARIHLDIAELGLNTGDYEAMRTEAEQARMLAEEHGNFETLMRSYRFLMTSYFRANDMEAAVQLALAARPILGETDDVTSKAFFMQFAALALNTCGHLATGREYTEQLRGLAASTSNPMYGAIADFTVMHRLYAQADFGRAYGFAASTRARLENEAANHSAIPQAVAFEAVAAARGGPLDVAQQLITEMETRYGDIAALSGPRLRAKGHYLFRLGKGQEAINVLREAETAMRETGASAVADYVGYELIELRLDVESAPPWDDINRISNGRQQNYQISRLTAQAHARDGNFLAATTALEEARLRGNELWSPEDQLLLEMYRSELLTAKAN